MSDVDFRAQLHPNGEKEIAYMGAAGMGLVFEGTLEDDCKLAACCSSHNVQIYCSGSQQGTC